MSYLVHYNTLLQNAIDSITKRDKSLLQNVSGFYYKMRQFITKYDSYYKTRLFHYKMERLLQNATYIHEYVNIVRFSNM